MFQLRFSRGRWCLLVTRQSCQFWYASHPWCNLPIPGTFGRVLECWDRMAKAYCAIKIVRNVDKYRHAAMIEVSTDNATNIQHLTPTVAGPAAAASPARCSALQHTLHVDRDTSCQLCMSLSSSLIFLLVSRL